MEGTSQSMSWNSDGMTTERKHDLEIRLQYRTILHVVLVLLQPSKRNPKEEEEETVAILPHLTSIESIQSSKRKKRKRYSGSLQANELISGHQVHRERL
jgi:hypothetical protein